MSKLFTDFWNGDNRFPKKHPELTAVTSSKQRGSRECGGGAVWNHIYHCGCLQWSHLEPGEVGAACPSACPMRGFLPRGQRGWSRGRGHRRQREGTRPLLLSPLHTLWREMKSKRDYMAPPSSTLTPHVPEDVLQGAPGCVCACVPMHACTCRCVPVYMRACAYVHMHVHMHLFVCAL